MSNKKPTKEEIVKSFKSKYKFDTDVTTFDVLKSKCQIIPEGFSKTDSSYTVKLEIEPEIQFHFEFSPKNPIPTLILALEQKKVQFRFLNSKKLINFIILSGSDTKFKGFTHDRELRICHSRKTAYNKLTFTLPNFPQFFSTSSYKFNGKNTLQFVHFSDDNFHIFLSNQQYTHENYKFSQNAKSSRMTHTGIVYDKNFGSLDTLKVNALMNRLHFFFSFINGNWTAPTIIESYNENGEKIWSDFSNRLTHPLHYRQTIFPQYSAESIFDLFENFSNLYQSPEWKDNLDSVIYWYLRCNKASSGIDGNIVLIQSALELLAFNFLVNVEKHLDVDAFQKLSAGQRIHLLLSILDLPTQIPVECAKLVSLAKKHNWVNAGQSLVEIRNEIVHPQHKKRGKFTEAYYQCWSLGMWFTEIIILRLCGYDNLFTSRMGRIDTTLNDLKELKFYAPRISGTHKR